MSLIIWEPRRYAEQFTEYQRYPSSTPIPVNGLEQSSPYDKDTVVREVVRFEGWTESYFRDTGEMEFTISPEQVTTADIKVGNLVYIDGAVYVIEAYTWEQTESGYQCTITGRDFGLFLDSRYWWTAGSDVLPFTIFDRQYSGVKLEDCAQILADFLNNDRIAPVEGLAHYKASGAKWSTAQQKMFTQGGFWKDEDRRTWSAVDDMLDIESGASTETAKGTRVVEEMPTIGALLRSWCAFHDVGYRFDWDFDEEAGVFTLAPYIYDREDLDVVLNTRGRGVSGFQYEYDTRDMVTAFYGIATYNEDTAARVNLIEKHGKNYADTQFIYREAFVDAGACPEEYQTSQNTVLTWLADTIGGAEFKGASETISFSYDNSGLYKYGVHFFLGSPVSIIDDFLNIGQSAILSKVRTNYSDKGKEYEFTFGDVDVTTADILKRRFSEVDKRTYKQRTTN